jgi:hypothetical protein
MKYRFSIVWRQARNLELFESSGRKCRNLRPVFDVRRRPAQSLAVFPIGRVVLELQGEQLKSEFLKLRSGLSEFLARNGRLEPLPHHLIYETSEPMCKSFNIVLGTHAVFILPGWFSATARGFYVHAK